VLAGALSSFLSDVLAGALSSFLSALAGAALVGAELVGAALVGAALAGLALVLVALAGLAVSPPQAEINKATDATVDKVNTLNFILFLVLPLNLVSNLFEQNFTKLPKQVGDSSINFVNVKRKMKKNRQKIKIFLTFF
jgi:Mg2+/Co2+ transporter CorB